MKRILSIVMFILIIGTVFTSLFACGKLPQTDDTGNANSSRNTDDIKLPQNIDDSEDYITDTIRYYRTAEQNFGPGNNVTVSISTQKSLFYNKLIFRGIYLSEEYFTLERDEEVDLPEKGLTKRTETVYYTYYKFRVTEVFKGDKSLENTEIYVMNSNLAIPEFYPYDIIPQEGREYLVFAEDREQVISEFAPERKSLYKTYYWTGWSQTVFPIMDNYVYSSMRLIDYNSVLSENSKNIFMNEWIEKQVDERVDRNSDKNSDENNDRNAISKNDIVSEWRIESMQTREEETERIGIPIDTFTDFLTSAIEYYNEEYYENLIANDISIFD